MTTLRFTHQGLEGRFIQRAYFSMSCHILITLIFWYNFRFIFMVDTLLPKREYNKFNKVLCTASRLKSLGKLILFLNQMKILEAFHKVYFDVFSRLINSSSKCGKFKSIHEDAYNCWCMNLPIWIFERLRLLLFVF